MKEVHKPTAPITAGRHSASHGRDADPPAGTAFDRRHDLDALRAGAMLLGIGLHAALAYVTFPYWPVHDDRQHAFLDMFVSAVHGFRMPLFFMISGFFTTMLWRRRGLGALVKHRVKRILLPLLLFVAPVYYVQDAVIDFAMRTVGKQSEQVTSSIDLWSAAKHNDVDALRQSLIGREMINSGDPQFGLPALNWAALNGSTDAARMLIESGADINVRTQDGSVPLGHAAFTGRADIVALLIEHGADLNPVNSYQATPLDSAQGEWGVVQFIAGMLSLQVDQSSVEAGQKAAAEVLVAHGAKHQSELSGDISASAVPRDVGDMGLLDRISETYLSWTSWRGFRDFQVLSHLWFLWFLCLLLLPFMLFARIADAVKWRGPSMRFFLSPWALLCWVPITMIPQWFHGLIIPGFGPDTSSGLFPAPHIVLLYGVFFYFGALYFDCEDVTGRLSRGWWWMLPLALLLIYPIGIRLSLQPQQSWIAARLPEDAVRPLAIMLQALYAWLMIFGSMGLFSRLFASENRVLRYISDSSYWLYVAHLPLIFVAQYLLKPLDLPASVKFGIACVTVTVILLASYDLVIRYTWVGTLLNGKRVRPKRLTAAANAAQKPSVASGELKAHSSAGESLTRYESNRLRGRTSREGA